MCIVRQKITSTLPQRFLDTIVKRAVGCSHNFVDNSSWQTLLEVETLLAQTGKKDDEILRRVSTILY
jgi:hypothetical protein